MGLDNPRLVLVETWEEAEEFRQWVTDLIASDEPWLGCDTETGGLLWWVEPLRTVQFGTADVGWVLPWDRWAGLIEDTFQRWDRILLFQNAKFDMHFLEREGIDVGRHRVHDTRIIAHLTNNVRFNGLKSLAASLVDSDANFLDHELKAGMKTHGWNWRTVPITFPAYWQYAALDPILTYRVWEEHQSELYEFAPLYDIEITVQQQLTDMEKRGALVDVEYCKDAIMGLESEMDELAERCRDFDVQSPTSNQQVIKAMLKDAVVFTKRTEKGNISLDEEVLKSLDHPLAELVIKYRHAKKICGTYLQNFIKLSDKDGYLHPDVNQLGARTGRMSVGRPSMQNLERSSLVRDAIIARPGHKLVLIDYDQIEYRLMAHYAGMESIREAAIAGVDLHTVTARLIYNVDEVTKEQRQITKNATFAKIYGAGIETFAETAQIPVVEAETFMAQYDLSNPEVPHFITELIRQVKVREDEEGVAYVTTHYGRRLRKHKGRGEYVLVNYLIQGTAADVLKEKMMRLSLEGLDDYLIMPVHDELVFDIPEDEIDELVPRLVEAMEEHTRFSVPLTVGVEIVDRWGDKYRKENT